MGCVGSTPKADEPKQKYAAPEKPKPAPAPAPAPVPVVAAKPPAPAPVVAASSKPIDEPIPPKPDPVKAADDIETAPSGVVNPEDISIQTENHDASPSGADEAQNARPDKEKQALRQEDGSNNSMDLNNNMIDLGNGAMMAADMTGDITGDMADAFAPQYLGGEDMGQTSTRRGGRESMDIRASTIDPTELEGEIAQIEKDIRTTSTLKKVMVSGKMMLNQYMVIKTLGKGNFGTVRLCFNLQDNRLYAIKTLNKKNLTRARGLRKRKDQDPLADLKREVAIMKKLRHPNLVRLYEVIDDPVSTKLLMVMEHVQGGPIRSEKAGPTCMSEQVVVHYFRDMCMGLDYLHFNHIVHADLKPDNMLLSAGGEVKITDFGCSRVLDENGWVASKSTGTPVFHAPEMTTGQPYNAYTADIWALGVTLYVFIFAVMPFDGKTIQELHANIANDPLTFPPAVYMSDELKDLLTRMLDKDFEQRIQLPEIMGHSWVTQGGMATINSLQHLQNPPPLVSEVSAAEESDAIRSDTCVALMQPCFEDTVFEHGDHLVRAGEKQDVVYYICSGQCEVIQMVSSMRTDEKKEPVSGDHTSNTVESAMFSQDDWSCVDVANPNSSMVDNMYQSLDRMQLVQFEHVVRTLGVGSFVGDVEQLDVVEYFPGNVSVVAKGQVSALSIKKTDLVQFLASRPEVEKVLRGRMAQAKADKLVQQTLGKVARDMAKHNAN